MTPAETVADCRGHEDNRVLECAPASGSILIVSDDTDVLDMSPWRGIPMVISTEFAARTECHATSVVDNLDGACFGIEARWKRPFHLLDRARSVSTATSSPSNPARPRRSTTHAWSQQSSAMV